MSENFYTVVAPSGKEFVMQSLPYHFYMFFGQLPAFNAGQVAEAIGHGVSKGVAEAEAEARNLTPEERLQMMEFQREAVLAACVKPKISMKPDRSKDEISPFELTGADFDFLSIAAISGKDGEAKRLEAFRQGQKETTVGGDNGAEIRAASEPVDTNSE